MPPTPDDPSKPGPYRPSTADYRVTYDEEQKGWVQIPTTPQERAQFLKREADMRRAEITTAVRDRILESAPGVLPPYDPARFQTDWQRTLLDYPSVHYTRRLLLDNAERSGVPLHKASQLTDSNSSVSKLTFYQGWIDGGRDTQEELNNLAELFNLQLNQKHIEPASEEAFQHRINNPLDVVTEHGSETNASTRTFQTNAQYMEAIRTAVEQSATKMRELRDQVEVDRRRIDRLLEKSRLYKERVQARLDEGYLPPEGVSSIKGLRFGITDYEVHSNRLAGQTAAYDTFEEVIKTLNQGLERLPKGVEVDKNFGDLQSNWGERDEDGRLVSQTTDSIRTPAGLMRYFQGLKIPADAQPGDPSTTLESGVRNIHKALLPYESNAVDQDVALDLLDLQTRVKDKPEVRAEILKGGDSFFKALENYDNLSEELRMQSLNSGTYGDMSAAIVKVMQTSELPLFTRSADSNDNSLDPEVAERVKLLRTLTGPDDEVRARAVAAEVFGEMVRMEEYERDKSAELEVENTVEEEPSVGGRAQGAYEKFKFWMGFAPESAYDEPEPEHSAEVIAFPLSQREPEPERDIEPEREPEIEPQPDAELNAEPHAELESEHEHEPQPELDAEPKPGPELQPEPEPEADADTELQSEPESELDDKHPLFSLEPDEEAIFEQRNETENARESVLSNAEPGESKDDSLRPEPDSHVEFDDDEHEAEHEMETPQEAEKTRDDDDRNLLFTPDPEFDSLMDEISAEHARRSAEAEPEVTTEPRKDESPIVRHQPEPEPELQRKPEPEPEPKREQKPKPEPEPEPKPEPKPEREPERKSRNEPKGPSDGMGL